MPLSYFDRVQLRSVRYFAAADLPLPTISSQISQFVESVNSTWFALLAKLRRQDILSEVLIDRLQACESPTFGGRRVWRCAVASVCPYCWAARAAKYWSAVDFALFPIAADGSRSAKQMKYDLAIQSVRRSLPVQYEFQDGVHAGWELLVGSRLGLLPGASLPLSDRFDVRAVEIKAIRRLGVLGSVECVVPAFGDGLHWLEVRQLRATTAGRRGPMIHTPAAPYVLESFAKPTREQVADCVGKLFEYSPRMLTDPTAITDWCGVSRGRRLVEPSGIFRRVVAQAEAATEATLLEQASANAAAVAATTKSEY